MPRYFPTMISCVGYAMTFRSPLLKQLEWPHKQREGQLAFLCPCCHECHSAVNPRTNLGRCFHCEINFNPIDFTMAVKPCDFVTAVHYLQPLLAPGKIPPASR